MAYELYLRASKFYQRAALLTQMSGTIKRKEGEAMVRDNTLRAAPRLHTPSYLNSVYHVTNRSMGLKG